MYLPRLLLTCTLCSASAVSAQADVERVVIDNVQTVAAGAPFGKAGAYVAMSGRIAFTLDPEDPANARIVDLDLAPRNDAGLVEALGDLHVLRPAAPEKANGVALVEVSNRGGMAVLNYFQGGRRGEPLSMENYGDGLLMNQGVTLVWIGWQFDVPEGRGLRLHVPRISEPTLSGLVRSDWVIESPTTTLPVAHRGHVPYPVSNPEHEDNVLTVRNGREDERRVVPREAWSFAREVDGEAQADPAHIHMADGFEPGKIYELVYRAENPAVVGMGLAVIRDTISHIKYDEDCRFPAQFGVALGISQTGRFLRQFLYQGFNTDEDGRRAYDGMFIHSAGAGRGSFNHRFAQPSRDGHRYSAFFYPTDIYPFSGRVQEDEVTGLRDGILPEENLPRIFYTNTGYEYWGRASSLLHTSLDGTQDVEPLANERIYHLASRQHFPVSFPPGNRHRDAQHDVYHANSISMIGTQRALLNALIAWVADGKVPPPSEYPRIDDGTLVTVDALESPTVPGLPWPKVTQLAYRADYGKRWIDGIIDEQPPILGEPFVTLVPQVDEIGNELGGVASFETLVPLATYAPWSLRTGMAGEQEELKDFYGSLAPLALTDEARADGDSRPSVSALYASDQEYLEQVQRAVEGLVEARFLLPEDAPRALRAAVSHWNWAHRERR